MEKHSENADCPLGKQSAANPICPLREVPIDHFQPQNRQAFACLMGLETMFPEQVCSLLLSKRLI